MTRKRSFSVALMLALFALALGMHASLATAKTPKILEFDTMVGAPQAFTGTQNPIRGINGGGLPWRLDAASGELTTSGRLEVKVTGLVLDAGTNAGSNPIASFRAVVSCLGADASVQNIVTEAVPATTGPAATGGGNAEIEADLALPQPCIAPIVFVTSPGGAWFASTGG